MADDAVMIEVFGTDVRDDVDPNGQFVLVGVAGSPNVVLRISSSTMDVTISLGEVREDETVTVTLAVVGNDVEMVNEGRDSDDNSDDDDSADENNSGPGNSSDDEDD